MVSGADVVVVGVCDAEVVDGLGRAGGLEGGDFGVVPSAMRTWVPARKQPIPVTPETFERAPPAAPRPPPPRAPPPAA